MDEMRPLVLLVDDRSPSRELVRDELVEAGFEVVEAQNGEGGWAAFLGRSCDLVITDLRMPRLDGMGLLRRIRGSDSPNAGVPVILLTAYGTLSLATAAGQAGATDCLPFDGSSLGDLVERARTLVSRRGEVRPDELLGESPEVQAVLERLAAAANLSSPLLISGEPGSGQESAAAFLHASSRFAADPITRVKCGTGSAVDSLPDRGIVLLEDVDRLDSAGGRIWERRLAEAGHAAPESAVRIVATASGRGGGTEAARSSTFWRRLSRFEIRLPALRARIQDLDVIVPRFVERAAQRLGRGAVALSPDALARLKSHGWPENFSELRQAVEMLVAFSPRNVVETETVDRVLADLDPVQRATRERQRREREELLHLLEECGGNYTHMAERLGVDRGTVKYRLRKYGIISGRRAQRGD